MAHSDGTDSFPAAEAQLDMFGAPPTQGYPDAEGVRAELADILAKVRAAPRDTLDACDVAHFRNIFSRMIDGLPADEADRLRLELETELARLTAS